VPALVRDPAGRLDLDALIYGPAPTPLPAPHAAASGKKNNNVVTRPESEQIQSGFLANQAFDLDSLTYGPAPIPTGAAAGTNGTLSKRAQDHISSVQRRMGLPPQLPQEAAPPVEPQVFKHIPFLDGLRALAILWVLTFHTCGPIGTFIAKRGGW